MRAPDGAQENVLRRVVGVSQLQRRRFVSGGLEARKAQRVGGRVAEFLLQHGVLRDEIKGVRVEVLQKLLLTAGGGENDARTECNRLAEHDVGGDVAGVERDGQMHRRRVGVVVDVAGVKGKPAVAEVSGRLGAEGDHVRLAVDAHHLHLAPHRHGEVVVDGEAEIAFAAAEVKYVQLARLRQIAVNFRHVLDEAVDLPELRLLFVVDAPVRVRDAERREKRLAAVKGIGLGAVVRGERDGFAVGGAGGGKFRLAEDGLTAAFRSAVFRLRAVPDQIDLRKAAERRRKPVRVRRADVFMQRLAVGRARLQLQDRLAAELDQLPVYARHRAVGGLGRHQLFEIPALCRGGDEGGKAGKCFAHFRLPSVSFFAFLSFFEKEILFSV